MSRHELSIGRPFHPTELPTVLGLQSWVARTIGTHEGNDVHLTPVSGVQATLLSRTTIDYACEHSSELEAYSDRHLSTLLHDTLPGSTRVDLLSDIKDQALVIKDTELALELDSPHLEREAGWLADSLSELANVQIYPIKYPRIIIARLGEMAADALKGEELPQLSKQISLQGISSVFRSRRFSFDRGRRRASRQHLRDKRPIRDLSA